MEKISPKETTKLVKKSPSFHTTHDGFRSHTPITYCKVLQISVQIIIIIIIYAMRWAKVGM
jgi:hypothetical protein